MFLNKKYMFSYLFYLTFLFLPVNSYAWQGTSNVGIFYSPDNDLEDLDIREINLATRSIDIAMYAFTDKKIANALLSAADRGVKIRIYRDKRQILDKNDQIKRMLINPNIQVRIKNNGKYNIMHLKAYVIDGLMLRDGSANWSPSGEGAWKPRSATYPEHTGAVQQDNSVVLTTDPMVVNVFMMHFNKLWNRESNIRDVGKFLSSNNM